MATATLVSAPTVIDNAESTANWVNDTFALNSGENIQGSNCIECALTTNGNNDVWVSGSWNFSTDVILRLWFLTTIVGNLSGTNPIQVILGDGSNQAFYQWTKGDSYLGGWEQIVCNTADTPLSGTVNKSAVTQIGIRFVTSTKPRNVPYNTLFDAWTYGDGFTVHGGTSGDELSWTEIAAADAAARYRIVEEVNGVFFLRGDIQVGDGANTTYFKPTGQVAVYVDEAVPASLYNLTFFDDASLLTNINIAGGAWSAGALRPTIDASAVCNAFTLDGLQMSKLGTITFHTGATVQNFSIDDCLQVDPKGSTFESFTISNYSEAAVNGALLWPGGTTVKNGNFLNCDEGIEITQTVDQTFDNLKFSGNTDDVHLNNGGTSITVNNNNGSNATSQISTGGGTITFSNPKTVTIKFNFLGANPANFEWRLYDDSGVNGELGTVELAGAESKTTFTDELYNYEYTADDDVVLQVIADGYEEAIKYFTLINGNQTQTIDVVPETNL